VCKSLLVFHRNYVVYRTVSEIFSVRNGVTLKPGQGSFKVIENGAVRQIIDLLVRNCKHSSTLYHFRVIWRWKYRGLEIWVRGHSRSFKLVPSESLGAVFYSPSIVTMVLSCSSFEIKPDTGRKWWFFHTTLAFGAPVRGSPSEYCHPVWYGKQEVKVIWQKAPHGGPIPRLGVTVGGRNLYHWIPGVGVPISVP